MRKLWKLAVAAGAAFSAVALIAAPSAEAAGTITGYGWDGSPHVIVGGGSETTYYVMNSINRVWQESTNSGCLHSTGVGPAQNSCASDQPNNLMNYEGDTIAQANPTGSGGGLGALVGGASGNSMQGTVNPISNPTRQDSGTTTSGSPNVADATATTADIGKVITGAGIPVATYVGPGTTAGNVKLSSAPDQQLDVNATASATVPVNLSHYGDCITGTTGPMPDFGRSSRGPNGGAAGPCSAELTSLTFWGYGQDGNELFGFNNHGTMLNGLGAFSPQQILQIWGCFGGTGSAVGAPRVDGSAAVTSGSATVTDPGITNGDIGHGVTGTGIPANTFVGKVDTTNANVNLHTFKLSSSATSQIDVLATSSGTGVTIAGAQRMRWSDVIPGLAGGAGGPNDADIIPWGMNSASGTFGTFNNYIIANTSAGPSWTMNSAGCDRKLQPDNIFPLENDIKPLINDPQSRTDTTGINVANGSSAVGDTAAGLTALDNGKVVSGTGIPACSYVRDVNPGVGFTLSSTPNATTPVNATAANNTSIAIGGISTCGTAPDNPENWMWQGSFANLSTFSFLSSFTRGINYQAIQAAINGVTANPSNILDQSWPLQRTIYHVTRKADADCVKTAGACDFAGHLGPALPAGGNDLNVTGAIGGTGGAVREFTRALCRQTNAQQGTDPYTGTNFGSALNTAIQGAGFTLIKSTQRTPSSRCHILS